MDHGNVLCDADGFTPSPHASMHRFVYHKAPTRLTGPFSINFSFFLPRFHNRNPFPSSYSSYPRDEEKPESFLVVLAIG